jgi:hypothetical protein
MLVRYTPRPTLVIALRWRLRCPRRRSSQATQASSSNWHRLGPKWMLIAGVPVLRVRRGWRVSWGKRALRIAREAGVSTE